MALRGCRGGRFGKVDRTVSGWRTWGDGARMGLVVSQGWDGGGAVVLGCPTGGGAAEAPFTAALPPPLTHNLQDELGEECKADERLCRSMGQSALARNRPCGCPPIRRHRHMRSSCYAALWAREERPCRWDVQGGGAAQPPSLFYISSVWSICGLYCRLCMAYVRLMCSL